HTARNRIAAVVKLADGSEDLIAGLFGNAAGTIDDARDRLNRYSGQLGHVSHGRRFDRHSIPSTRTWCQVERSSERSTKIIEVFSDDCQEKGSFRTNLSNPSSIRRGE